MELYRILQDIMDLKALSIPEVARLSGLSDSTVRAILVRKSKTVSLEVAFKLAAGLSVSLEDLYYGTVADEHSSTEFHNRIRQRREELEMSQEEIGEGTKEDPIAQGNGVYINDSELIELIDGIKKLPKHRWLEVKGMISHMLYEEGAADAAKQISDHLA